MWTSQQGFKRDFFLLIFLLIFLDIVYTANIDWSLRLARMVMVLKEWYASETKGEYRVGRKKQEAEGGIDG
jgi:hypothetical protein